MKLLTSIHENWIIHWWIEMERNSAWNLTANKQCPAHIGIWLFTKLIEWKATGSIRPCEETSSDGDDIAKVPASFRLQEILSEREWRTLSLNLREHHFVSPLNNVHAFPWIDFFKDFFFYSSTYLIEIVGLWSTVRGSNPIWGVASPLCINHWRSIIYAIQLTISLDSSIIHLKACFLKK